ncbi:MAG: hypothetical protein KDC54_04295, partial [Lewinella sp.]|nr:hypothetical protein [Lewinella sp.]
LAIPFKTFRYNEGSRAWRFNCYRNDSQNNEWSTWNRVARNFRIMNLAFMGQLHWEEPLARPGANVSVIPYTLVDMQRDFEDPTEEGPRFSGNIGGDAKVAITPALNLDLTVNPDFSQVEVDEQVTNLDRFELFFPERRQFFLENADLFGGFGLSRVNPFFSRRIGVAVDTATGINVQNAIRYGARLSGKLNDRLRVGLLNMQAAPLKQSGLPGFNYTVAAVQQQVFSRSNLSFIMVNKQATGNAEPNGPFNAYNRVAGIEYRLATPDNSWTGKAFYHRVFSPLVADHKFSQGLQLEHQRRRWRAEWAHLMVGQGFDAEVGFVPRRDYLLLSPEAQVYFFPQGREVVQHDFNLDTRFFFQVGKDGNEVLAPWSLAEQQVELAWNFRTRNNVEGGVTITDNELVLLEAFDPTRLQEDGIALPAGGRYHFVEAIFNYQSDDRQPFSYELEHTLSGLYGGIRAGLNSSVTWRYQPYGFISINVNYNYISLPDPFQPVSIWLVGPRIDLTFSKQLFLTTFLQYNNQLENFNINARLQWRYAPVSDLFLVYTDNYYTPSFSQFSTRNRALVAKVTYWLNL